jgi:ATP-dependent exoDNAse (exonuclease V) beta subunit
VLASLDFLRQEEMRVLYVALTRAREQLIVTLRTKDAAKYLERLEARGIKAAYPCEEILGKDAHTVLSKIDSIFDFIECI